MEASELDLSKCRICEQEFNTFINFGEMPIANAFSPVWPAIDQETFTMQVGLCEQCFMVQLTDQPDRSKMFHDSYAFYSSTSRAMEQHFRKFAADIIGRENLNDMSFVVEIGCNDGIMLRNMVDLGVPCLGVEPSGNVAEVARNRGIKVEQSFFDKDLAEKILSEQKPANLIFSANVMCHIPYMHSVLEGVVRLLHDDGLFVFEDPYLGAVLEKNSFDQIYDEHVFLFSAHSVKYMANRNGMDLVHVEPQSTHGGSMRYYLAHMGARPVNKSVDAFLDKEKVIGLNKFVTFNKFSKNIDNIGRDLLSLLTEIKRKGKKVVGYGATSKSTTVNNYFGITPDLVSCIYDTTPSKIGTFSPGVGIPIKSYDEFRVSNPDYVLLYAWNHADEIIKKEGDFMMGDRRWITYIPDVRVL